MLLDVSEIEGHEKETLYIMGNGFDIAHNIESSYCDYRQWLLDNGHNQLVADIEEMFYKGKETSFLDKNKLQAILWKDFENALGVLNAGTAYNLLEGTFGDVVNDVVQQNIAEEYVSKIIEEVNSTMSEWTKSINTSNARRRMLLDEESKYLTFNYTLTLEETYRISPNQICHIHGKVNDERVVVGCATDVNRDDWGVSLEDRIYKKRINKVFSQFNKQTDDIMIQNSDFFDSLKSIRYIVVIGHSLSDIDKPYFARVLQKVNKYAQWLISAYCDSDKVNAKYFIENINAGQEIFRSTIIPINRKDSLINNKT